MPAYNSIISTRDCRRVLNKELKSSSEKITIIINQLDVDKTKRMIFGSNHLWTQENKLKLNFWAEFIVEEMNPLCGGKKNGGLPAVGRSSNVWMSNIKAHAGGPWMKHTHSSERQNVIKNIWVSWRPEVLMELMLSWDERDDRFTPPGVKINKKKTSAVSWVTLRTIWEKKQK